MSRESISSEAFAALIEALKLKVNDEELEELREAYISLLRVKDNVRKAATRDTEPAHVFLPLDHLTCPLPEEVGVMQTLPVDPRRL